MPAAPASSAELLDLLGKTGLLKPERFAQLAALGLPDDPKKTAEILVGRGVVTKFQAHQLLLGRHRGFRIGAYAILDILGRGGMGAVYLAEHLELHRKVAIKVLVPGKEDDQKLAVERFLREARSAAALDHPNIVHIFDVSRYGEVPYLVMEFVDGDTLQQILDRDGPIPFTTATEYAAQAAAGLQHAHERGFVHRDIKPANLIRDKTGVVRILDMGLARSSSAADKLTAQLDADAIVGTADFIAPEQAMNQAGVDGRADIYSLGATIFSLVTGKPPFDGNTAQKLLQHQLKDPPTLASLDATIPKGLSAVVTRMMAKKPEDRFQAPAEVIAALTPWLGNSARILAGLSRTNIGRGADLHAALSEVGRAGSSRRLNPNGTAVAEAGPDSGDVNPSVVEKETGAVANAATTRAPTRGRKSAAKKAVRRPVLLYSLIGTTMLAAGALAGWIAFGPKKEPARQAETPPAAPATPEPAAKGEPAPPPKPGPKGDPVPPRKADPPPRELPVYKFDPAQLAPFQVRLKGGNVVDGKPGALPAGVAVYALNNSEATFAAGPADGTPALTITRHGTTPGVHVAFELEREPTAQGLGLKLKPDTEYKLRVRYRAGGAAPLVVGVHTLKYEPVDGGRKTLTATGDQWKTAELTFRRGANPLRMTIEARDGPASLGTIELVELAPVAAGEPVAYRLDLSDQKPFVIRSVVKVDPADPTNPAKKAARVTGRTGPGDLPAGWQARPWNATSEMEAFAEEAGGKMALGLRTVRGPGSAMFFTPSFECPGGACRVAFEYQSTAKEKRFVVKFKANDARAAWTVATPPPTGKAWRAENPVVDLKGAPGGLIEFHNNDDDLAAVVRLRAVVVTDPGGPAPAPGGADPDPPPDDVSRWAEGETIYTLDVTTIPEFRVQKEQLARLSGEPEQLPAGVGCQAWREKAVGEFRCEKVDGVPALTVTNLNDQKSGQFYFQLEGGMKLPLQPGKAYRVKVDYTTKNEAAGGVSVQVTPGFKGLAAAPLPNTDGKWKTAVAAFTRPPAADNVEVRMAIDNESVGEGNTLCVRSVEIVELVPPGKK